MIIIMSSYLSPRFKYVCDLSYIRRLASRFFVAPKEINHMQKITIIQSPQLTVPVSDVSSVIVFPPLLLSACSFL